MGIQEFEVHFPFSSNGFLFVRVDQKLVEIGYKSDSKFLNRCNLMSMGKKSYGHGFVFRVDPLPSGRRHPGLAIAPR